MLMKEAARAGVALCLSGRGYEAMLFQAGCLSRLNELGWLPKLDCVASVSGGAIAAGVLAHAWASLDFDGDGIARQFDARVVVPLRRLASETIEDWCLLGAAFSTFSPGEIVANALDEYLFSGVHLEDLPADGTAPRFVFTASNPAAGSLFAFSRSRIWDTRGGDTRRPDLRLSLAVAAATSAPPWLSTVLHLADSEWDAPHDGSRAEPLTLVDGSVVDSLAIELVRDTYRVLLVSDGDDGTLRDPQPPSDCMSQATRIVDVLGERLRVARRRELLNALAMPVGEGPVGAYWQLAAENDASRDVPTPSTSAAGALRGVDERRQDDLIRRGYATCEAAMRQSFKADRHAAAARAEVGAATPLHAVGHA